MPNFILLPIQINALKIDKGDFQIAGPLVDFTQLPWAQNCENFNPYLSEEITAPLFDYTYCSLGQGTHLHWSLPAALTGSMAFPFSYKQAFLSMFGDQKGEAIWVQLINNNWLKPLTQSDSIALSAVPENISADNPALNGYKEEANSILQLLHQTHFPPVPNRWLVNTLKDQKVVDSMVVESDYLWPTDIETTKDGEDMYYHYTAFPVQQNSLNDKPFRYMGRAVPMGTDAKAGDEYLSHPLTAVGYGKSSFAAFYPSCRSVFGYHDTESGDEAVSYEVIGWYSNPEEDYWSMFIDAFKIQWHQDHNTTKTTDITGINIIHQQKNYLYLDLLHAVYRQLRCQPPVQISPDSLNSIKANTFEHLQSLHWIDNEGQLKAKAFAPESVLGSDFIAMDDPIRSALNMAIHDAQLPEQLICYAKYNEAGEQMVVPDTSNIQLAIGNSPTEALSALLASSFKIPSAHQKTIEDQLEAMQFTSRLHHATSDIGPIFEGLRHEKQFTPEPGGQLWRIKAKNLSKQKASGVANDQQITLPDNLGNELNELNELQEKVNHIDFEIEAMRRQIFADWTLFMKKEGSYNQLIADASPDNPDDTNPEDGGWGGNNSEQGTTDKYAGAEGSPGIGADQIDELKKISKFISWEIDVRLKALTDQQTDLQGKLAAKIEHLRHGLLSYQESVQYIKPDDANNWEELIAFVKAPQSPLPPEFGTLKQDTRRADMINHLNAWIENAAVPSFTPQSKSSQEIQQLLTQQSNKTLGSSGEIRLKRLWLEATIPLIKHQPNYLLETMTAPRFWRPNDPVVFISGLDPSIHHQYNIKDPVKGVQIDLDIAPSIQDQKSITNLQETLNGKKLTSFASPNKADWSPFFMDWDVGFEQVKQKGDDSYSPTYLENYYHLGQTDYKWQPGEQDVTQQYDSQIDFTGRSILTPNATIALKKTLVAKVLPALMEQFFTDNSINKAKPAPTIAQFNKWIAPIANNPLVDDTGVQALDQIEAWLSNALNNCTDTNSVLCSRLNDCIGTKVSSPVLKQFIKGAPKQGYIANHLNDFLPWAISRLNIKGTYFENVTDKSVPLDIYLMDNGDRLNTFTNWLANEMDSSLERYYQVMEISGKNQANHLSTNYNSIISWYQAEVDEALHLVVQILSFNQLIDVRGLAQSLSGLDKAFVMQQQAYQLPVNDPFPFDHKNDFTLKVRQAVQGANIIAPAENLPFSPIRAGKMHLQRLTLVDTFGRNLAITAEGNDHKPKVIAADTFTTIEGDTFIVPPRFVQAARLDFRWIAANEEVGEMNDHPATNPICGWVLPNNLDGSLMIYSQSGDALGYVDQSGDWHVSPGGIRPILPADIENPHLAKMVTWLCSQKSKDSSFISSFITTLDIAQENMAPENYAQHEALALLVGQPLALVRASVNIHLKEPPAIDVSEDQFEKDVAAYSALNDSHTPKATDLPRNSFQFENVQVPLRVGEFRRLSDGLAGYWIEDNENYKADQFYAPQTTPLDGLPDNIIIRHNTSSESDGENQFLFHLRLNQSEPLKLAMLIDPRNKVHANCGLLPIKDIHIPSDQFVSALQKMQITFLTAPIITPTDGIQVSLPQEPGFDWSWIQKDGQHWTEIAAPGVLKLHQLKPLFGAAADQVWAMLHQEGWLTMMDDSVASIVPKDQRPNPTLPATYANIENALEHLLQSATITPFDTKVRFNQQQKIREGWLKLSPADRNDN